MKRSAALDLIADVYWPHIENGEIGSLAEKILAKLEEAGMLPPRTELKSMPGTFDNAWEAEDENSSQRT